VARSGQGVSPGDHPAQSAGGSRTRADRLVA
jgi:hypothetical protein